MTVTADSYEAQAIALAIAMLTNSSTWKTVVGATTAAEAQAFVVETHSGAPGQNDGRLGTGTAVNGAKINLAEPTYAIVGLDPGMNTEVGGIGYVDYDFTIGIRIVWPRTIGDETPAEASRRAWNKTGLVRSEMQALVGGAGYLADAEVKSEGLFMDEEGIHKKHVITQLLITARG